MAAVLATPESDLPTLRRSLSDSKLAPEAPSSRQLPRQLRFDEAQFDYSLTFAGTSFAEQQAIQQRVESQMLQLQVARQTSEADLGGKTAERDTFNLAEVLPFIAEGVETVVDDEFTRCFDSRPPQPWSWNAYLFPAWLLGVAFRYLVLFPLRLLCFLLGWLGFVLAFVCVQHFVASVERRRHLERKLIRFICGVFVLSWSGVIRYHGVMPRHQPNQIYVANHSSMIDMIVLQQRHTFSLVGQKHPSWIGFLQQRVLSCLGCIWFNRGEANDRLAVAKRIKDHIAAPDSNPLLLFPEGTCVNNEYCVRFRKGVFEMGARVVPIAIKYNKIFVDAYWNSRKQSFQRHLLRLMTCWAVVCDVWFLEPQSQLPGESAAQFCSRVQRLIAAKAKLKVVDFDGYMKHFRPSPKFAEERQALYAKQLKARLRLDPLSRKPSAELADLRLRRPPLPAGQPAAVPERSAKEEQSA